MNSSPLDRASVRMPTNRFRAAFSRAAVLMGLFFVAAGMDSASCQGPSGNNNNNNGHPTGRKPDVDESRDHILVWDGEAPAITVVEYADLQCPACGSFARTHFDRLKTDYIDTGKIRYVYRHYPLNSHPRAIPLAEAAECISNEDEAAFFQYVEEIFSDQSDLTDARMRTVADSLGVDLDDYDDCLAGDGELLRINEDRTSGDALELEVTPTFYVEDSHIGQGGQTVNQIAESLFDEIDRRLAE
jgi:protein-disulfide isomerase